MVICFQKERIHVVAIAPHLFLGRDTDTWPLYHVMASRVMDKGKGIDDCSESNVARMNHYIFATLCGQELPTVEYHPPTIPNRKADRMPTHNVSSVGAIVQSA